jgi:NodT family efflux transporter outer membrane factor (OMF) lipoprotein
MWSVFGDPVLNDLIRTAYGQNVNLRVAGTRVLEARAQVYAQQNVELQQSSLKIATDRWKAGQTNELGVTQATSLLEQLESTIPVLEIQLRQTNNAICVLLGIPPTELAAKLGRSPIPETPPEIIVGIPADLIRRRPDLRSAERLIAAQNAQIGVAEAAWYPSFFISGSLGYEAKDLGHLFASKSFTGQVGPGFQWNILNYGRILNNVRLQDFKTQELVGTYQQNVLSAAQEVENGIISYLNAHDEAAHLVASVKAAQRTVTLALAMFRAGTIDYTPVFVAEQFLEQQQIVLAQAQGDIALGLIAVYRALGGGWELRLTEGVALQKAAPSPGDSPTREVLLPPATELP